MNKSILCCAVASIAAGSASAAVVNVTADIVANEKWISTNEYVLDGVIFVKDGATLDIEPGTVIRGQPDADSLVAGSLVIAPDGKIAARGSNSNPVIFTTAALDVNNDGVVDLVTSKPVRWTAGQDANFWDKTPKTSPMPVATDASTYKDGRNYALWGGLVLMGDAPTNNANQVESDSVGGITNADRGFGIVEGLEPFGAEATYGGFNSAHNAGIVKYVSIRHGGIGLAADKEINALTCYAVGSETTIENVDIYCTSDDGVEIFGGTVNLKNLNINYADDDGLDTDEGWRGTAQFVFVLQGTIPEVTYDHDANPLTAEIAVTFGDNGLEIDGEDKAEKQPNIANSGVVIDPLPFGRIYNVTVWQNRTASNAARFRAGYAGVIANSIFANISGTTAGLGLRVDGLVTTSTTGNNETSPSARDNFNTGLFQVRNNSVVGFQTGYTAVSGTVAMSATGAVTGTFAGAAVGLGNPFYPATLNRNVTLLSDLFDSTISHSAANGIDPRPALTAGANQYASTQDPAYVTAPLVSTSYKGAFDRTSASLWTSGWTALNKRGILKN